MDTNQGGDLLSGFYGIYAIRSHLIAEQSKINEYLIIEFARYTDLFINSHIRPKVKVAYTSLDRCTFDNYNEALFNGLVDDVVPGYLDELLIVIDDLYENIVNLNDVNSKFLRNIDILDMSSLLVSDGHMDGNLVKGLEDYSVDDAVLELYKSEISEHKGLLESNIEKIINLSKSIDGISSMDAGELNNICEPISLFDKHLSNVQSSDSDSVMVLNAALLEKSYGEVKTIINSSLKNNNSYAITGASEGSTIKNLGLLMQNISSKKSVIMDAAFDKLGYTIQVKSKLLKKDKVHVFRSIN